MRAGRVTSCAITACFVVCCSCRLLPVPKTVAPQAEHRITVGQLEFRSDFPLAEDHRLVRELIAERDVVCQTLGLPYTNEPIHVDLFSDATRYGEFLERHFPSVPSRRAFFVRTDTQLKIYAHWSDRVAEDLRHEVAHGYLHAAGLALPLWLDEGLAEYFEVPRGHGGLNKPHVQLLGDMMALDGWRPDLERLEKLTDAAEMDQRDYAESWAWVYFLLESEPQRRELLLSYLRDLHEQGATPPLSRRLARKYVEPETTLAEYLAGLKLEVVAGGVATRDREAAN
jgi:Protein of unknown function (DUF1570)